MVHNLTIARYRPSFLLKAKKERKDISPFGARWLRIELSKSSSITIASKINLYRRNANRSHTLSYLAAQRPYLLQYVHSPVVPIDVRESSHHEPDMTSLQPVVRHRAHYASDSEKNHVARAILPGADNYHFLFPAASPLLPHAGNTEHARANFTGESSKTASRADTVRMAVLVTLVVQNSTQALFMRAAFKKDDEGASSGENGGEVKPQAASTTAVLMAEVFKLVASLCLQLRVRWAETRWKKKVSGRAGGRDGGWLMLRPYHKKFMATTVVFIGYNVK